MRLMWISIKIPNEVIGFVRSKVKMITENRLAKKNYPHFHSFF